MILLLLSLVSGYKLLPNLTCRIPKYFQPCNEINKGILNIAMDVFEELRYNGIQIGIGLSNNTICTNPTVHYGVMIYDPFDPYTTCPDCKRQKMAQTIAEVAQPAMTRRKK